jgi:D-3-phosphoglycerate dehydrogenase / 2-oxoglutarate reductase
MHVTILDDYVDVVHTLSCYSKLAGHTVRVSTGCIRDFDRLAEFLKDTEALVLLRERTRITRALIERLPRLRMITLNGPWPHIDVEACTERGILVCSEHGRTSYATAELTWGLVLCAVRHIPDQVMQLKRGGWQTRIGTGLRNRTLGVWGYGRIGKQVASYGRAFGMRVLVWSREKARQYARKDGYAVPDSRDVLFEEADVLSLHVRLVRETRGIVSAADLARMKPTAVLVNTSRAGLIEDGALEAALRAGRPGSAAVDVYEEEPVFDARHPLLTLDNAVCTPHLGYVERDQLENYFSDQFDRVLAFARGEPHGVINPLQP